MALVAWIAHLRWQAQRSSQPGGTEMRRPLGLTVIGGLLVSQAVTLYTTPVAYL